MSTVKKDPEAAGHLQLSRARNYIKHKFPYFYRMLLGFIVYPRTGLGTLYVTKTMVLNIDLVWITSITVEQLAGLLMRQEMRLLKGFDRILQMPDISLALYAFNIPTDDDLAAFKVELPDGEPYSHTHKYKPGLSGEKYYELLEKDDFKPQGPIITRAALLESPPDEPGRSASEASHFQRQGLKDLQDHAAGGGFGRGFMSGSFRELLEFSGKEEAIVPWQHVAGHATGNAFGSVTHGQTDYSLRRPSKRSYTVGLLRPDLIAYEPTIVYIEDTSGSMGAHQLKENRVEMCNAMRQLGATEVWFLEADAAVSAEPHLVGIEELMTAPVIGRGGTDFCGPIEAALKITPRPDIIIYSTDGDGSAPEYPPQNVEFIWLLAPGPWTRSPCVWGTQILTSNDAEERKKYKLLGH